MISEGDCSGDFKVTSQKQVDGKKMAKLLLMERKYGDIVTHEDINGAKKKKRRRNKSKDGSQQQVVADELTSLD
jgi:hypothetical protein